RPAPPPDLPPFPTRRSSDLRAGVLRQQCRPRGRLQGSDGNQQIAGRPTDIDHTPGTVLADGREVGKAAVRQQVGEQSACEQVQRDRKSTRLNSSHLGISYAV